MAGGAVGPVGVLARLAHGAASVGLCLQRRIEFRLKTAHVVCGCPRSVMGPGQRSLRAFPVSFGASGVAVCVLLLLPGPAQLLTASRRRVRPGPPAWLSSLPVCRGTGNSGRGADVDAGEPAAGQA